MSSKFDLSSSKWFEVRYIWVRSNTKRKLNKSFLHLPPIFDDFSKFQKTEIQFVGRLPCAALMMSRDMMMTHTPGMALNDQKL